MCALVFLVSLLNFSRKVLVECLDLVLKDDIQSRTSKLFFGEILTSSVH